MTQPPSWTDEAMTEVRAIARDTLAPISHAGTPGLVNRELVRALGDTGLLPRLFPRRLGGTSDSDVSAAELCRLRESLARENVEAETALAVQGLGTYPIVQSAPEALAQRWVPGIARGELVAAFALTEPDAGTDAAALSLRADRVEGGFRLTGTKKWISNAPDADVYTVFARTTPDTRAKGVSAFVVAGDAEGVSGEPIELLSDHAVGTLELDGVFVADDEMLGELDRGFTVAMRTLDLFRPSVGALALGMGWAALDASVAYAQKREAFGRPIADFQAISHQLAEMATDLEASRHLVYAAANAYDEGRHERITRQAAMAKLHATETAQRIVDAAIQIHGAVALQRDHLLAQLYRDVRAPRIYEGTSEIQRSIIARELFAGR